MAEPLPIWGLCPHDYQFSNKLSIIATRAFSLRIYLVTDSCGLEKMSFEWKKDPDTEWRGGDIGGPLGGYWMYGDTAAGLIPGDIIIYRAMVRIGGRAFRKPDTPWRVNGIKHLNYRTR